MICKIWTSDEICPDFHCPGRGIAETIKQQESIPVGCIPPTLHCMGEGLPDRDHTPGQRPPLAEIPIDRDLLTETHLDRVPPWQEPGTRDPQRK